jgi:hypothetical protein
MRAIGKTDVEGCYPTREIRDPVMNLLYLPTRVGVLIFVVVGTYGFHRNVRDRTNRFFALGACSLALMDVGTSCPLCILGEEPSLFWK